MRIAHLSDVHVVDVAGAVPARLLNKRLTGYVNLRLRRADAHRTAIARQVLEETRRLAPDHVVITGDMTYLALEREFDGARRLLQDALGLPPDRVTVVPGNHDVYTRGAARSGRFEAYLGAYATSDLPNVAAPRQQFTYPFVRLRGPVALIGLSTAIPAPPLVASGLLGAAQRAALRRILQHETLRQRTPVLLQHHPPIGPSSPWAMLLGGLLDAGAERKLLALAGPALVLHGHLHLRSQQLFRTPRGGFRIIGATSASLVDPRPDRAAGLNVLELSDEDGSLQDLYARVRDPDHQSFQRTPIPVGPTPVSRAAPPGEPDRPTGRPDGQAR